MALAIFLAILLLAGSVDCKPMLLTAARGGRCGPNFSTKCGYQQCCSGDGYCGETDQHCEETCQLGWGKCGQQYVAEAPTTSEDQLPTANETPNPVGAAGALQPTPGVAKGGGKCGAAVNALCPGQCCSNANYCGYEEAHCLLGCQPEWGVCGRRYVQYEEGAASFGSDTTAPSAATANGSDTAKSFAATSNWSGTDMPPPPAQVPLPVQAIVGIIVGVLSAIGLLGGTTCYCYKYSNRRHAEVGRNQEIANDGGVVIITTGPVNNHGKIGNSTNSAGANNSTNDVHVSVTAHGGDQICLPKAAATWWPASRSMAADTRAAPATTGQAIIEMSHATSPLHPLPPVSKEVAAFCRSCSTRPSEVFLEIAEEPGGADQAKGHP